MKDRDLRIKAIALIEEGYSVRKTASRLGVSKSIVSKWYREYIASTGDRARQAKQPEAIAEVKRIKNSPPLKNVRVRDSYAEYVGTLKTIKDRQGKWASAITETGIRALKLANKYMAVIENKNDLAKSDIELLKLVPNLLSSSSSAIKSAAEAEDRAYSLELLVDTLNELPQQVTRPSPEANPKTVVAEPN